MANMVKPHGSKFGRHLSLMWEDLIPHLRVLLSHLKWKKKISKKFIMIILVLMVDDIFLCADLDRKDFCAIKDKESIAFFVSDFRLGLILLVLGAEQ